jgi:hypothetical protein
VDVGATVEGASQQPGVLGHVGGDHLREPQDGEVMDGDEPAGSPRRRDHEVRTPHGVDGAGPPLDPRVVPTAPRPPQRPGRHRSAADGDPQLGLEVVEAVAAAPRRGVPDDVEVVEPGQTGHEVPGHHGHARRRVEQRGDVDGEAHAGPSS